MKSVRNKLSIFLVMMIVFACSASLVEATTSNSLEETWNTTTTSVNSSEPSTSATDQQEVNKQSSNNQTLIDNFVMQTAHNWKSVVNKSLDFVILSAVSDNSTIISKISTVAKRIGWSLAVFCIVTPVAPLAFLLILCCLGFTCSGVIALSCAAICQSRIGNVAAGSCFALMQSVAADGSPKLLLVFGLLFGIPSGITAGIYDWPCKLIIQANSTNLDWLLWSCSQDS